MAMNKKYKIGLWILGFGIAVPVVYYGGKALFGSSDKDEFIKKLQAQLAEAEAKGDAAAVEEISNTIATVQNTPPGFPLKRGSVGAQVKKVQQWLIQKFGSNAVGSYGADGHFGPATEAAVKAHISLDGEVKEPWYDINILGKAITTKDGISVGDAIHANSTTSLKTVVMPAQTIFLGNGMHAGTVKSIETNGFKVELNGTLYITSGFASYSKGGGTTSGGLY